MSLNVNCFIFIEKQYTLIVNALQNKIKIIYLFFKKNYGFKYLIISRLEVFGQALLIITGAMLPERFSNSDAPTNLGCAIATANLMDKGVFIAMHGIVKPASEIKRNLETGKYY